VPVGDNSGRSAEVVGEQVRERERRSLPVVAVVLGLLLVVLVLLSIALVYGFAGSTDPKTVSIVSPTSPAQTATARTASLALSPTVVLTVRPTQTTPSLLAATTTPPPTATPARIDTPTATTAPGATSIPTSSPAPSATPSPASITYVVQPGDTLTYIARNFGTTVEALMAANGLSSTAITAGQVLQIP